MKIAYTDWKTKHIYDSNLLFLILGGLGAIWMIPEISFMQRTGGFFSVSVPMLFLANILPGSIGGGDIKLMTAGGFLLGISGIWSAFVIGIFLAGAYVAGLLVMKKVNRKTEIALGPFLCAGIMIVFWV